MAKKDEEQDEFIRFVERGPLSRLHKTNRWAVEALDGTLLGEVKWFSAWRRYCFMPERETVFEEECLRGIARFIAARSKEHKGG